MRTFLVGALGMLGQDVAIELDRRGWAWRGPARSDFDPLRPSDRARFVRGEWGEFDWIVNCAGYTQVDRAESEISTAIAANVTVPGVLAALGDELGCRVLHIGSDYVFDGSKGEPYTESDATNPLSVYGKSKRLGEEATREASPSAIVLRSSWLYGLGGRSFPISMIEAAEAGKPVRVVNDQTGTPTSTVDLARTVLDIVALGPPGGIYHAAGPDVTTWYGLALASLEAWSDVSGMPMPEVTAVASDAFPTVATRPAYSALVSERLPSLGIAPMRPLAVSLAEFATGLKRRRERG